jgi:DNA mismatch endonuclease (patch repair protein)
MSKIKSKDTKPEQIFRKKLWELGYRYKKNVKSLPGAPDIVFEKYKLVVFIDGEFWHGYNWIEKKQKLNTNKRFWIPKIERNMQRDIVNNDKLGKMGYEVFRFWEQDLKKNQDLCIKEVTSYIDAIKSNASRNLNQNPKY